MAPIAFKGFKSGQNASPAASITITMTGFVDAASVAYTPLANETILVFLSYPGNRTASTASTGWTLVPGTSKLAGSGASGADARGIVFSARVASDGTPPGSIVIDFSGGTARCVASVHIYSNVDPLLINAMGANGEGNPGGTTSTMTAPAPANTVPGVMQVGFVAINPSASGFTESVSAPFTGRLLYGNNADSSIVAADNGPTGTPVALNASSTDTGTSRWVAYNFALWPQGVYPANPGSWVQTIVRQTSYARPAQYDSTDARLTWRPPDYPSYSGYTTVHVSNATPAPTIPGGDVKVVFDEVITVVGGVQLVGACRNLVLIGGEIDFSAQAAGRVNTSMRGLYVNNPTGRVHLEGLYIHGKPPGPKNVTAVGSTGVFTSTAHGFVTNDAVSVGGLTGGSTLVSGNKYWIVAAAANTFQLATSLGGAAVTGFTDVTAGGVYYRQGALGDALQTNNILGPGSGLQRQTSITVQNCRMEWVRMETDNHQLGTGDYTGNSGHADGWQWYGGATNCVGRMDKVTMITLYQGHFTQATFPHAQDWRRVNIDGARSFSGVGTTGPLSSCFYNSSMATPWRVTCQDVYASWPTNKTRAQALLPDLGPSWTLRAFDTIVQGNPPGGDWCPAGVAGASYVSPGYRW